jgi:N-acetylmuramoyl-L-alanine amidase
MSCVAATHPRLLTLQVNSPIEEGGARISPRLQRRVFFLVSVVLATLLFATCVAPQHQTSRLPGVRLALLPPNVHGRLIGRTMRPRFITIHSTENIGATADTHARYLTVKGKRSRNNPRFGRSGWVVWHFTVDDREVVEHLLPTEQGDHADYGGPGDRQSIGIEICEFRDRVRQAAAIDRAARLAAILADRYQIPTSGIVPHMHWPRWDFPHGKSCPRILLERDRQAPGGWRTGLKWDRFIARVKWYR